jgi:hypothetical protein
VSVRPGRAVLFRLFPMSGQTAALNWVSGRFGEFTLKKLGCLKQALAVVNTLAWDNRIWRELCLVGLESCCNG